MTRTLSKHKFEGNYLKQGTRTGDILSSGTGIGDIPSPNHKEGFEQL